MLNSGPLNGSLSLTFTPPEVFEGQMVVMECVAHLYPAKAACVFTWRMKGQVASNGERIQIDTRDGPDESVIISRLVLAPSSWTDNGKTYNYLYLYTNRFYFIFAMHAVVDKEIKGGLMWL